jgi:4-hydroxy-tetrahydrodipicolinate synthase
VHIPIIVQDASGYVGRPLSIGMQAKLLDQYGAERILFKPEAAPIGPRLSELHAATGGQARVFEGSGGIALVESYRRGIVGTMPGAEIVDAILALWQALETGDDRRVDQLAQPVAALVALQNGLDGFLAVEKYLLHKQGIFRNTVVRGPVAFVMDEATRREVDGLFEKLMRAVKGDA